MAEIEQTLQQELVLVANFSTRPPGLQAGTAEPIVDCPHPPCGRFSDTDCRQPDSGGGIDNNVSSGDHAA
jgi:hypothetical protein